MIDLSGFTMPDDSPEIGSCARIEYPEEKLAHLILDPPHRKLAVLDLPLMRDLDLALDELEGKREIRGLVVRGREPLAFAAGADLDALASIDGAAQGELLARLGQKIYQRLDDLAARSVRVVAAVGGPVPGGAYELCLACALIVAADHGKTRIGLPETKLGILPGWGGTQRLPRRIGIPQALDAILAGKLYPARPAYKKGLVDRITHPEYLYRVAGDLALGREKPRIKKRGLARFLVDRNPLALRLIEKKAGAALRKKTRGHYPAPEQALDLILTAPRTPLRRGLADEARALGSLAASETCKNLVTIFRLMEDAKCLGKDGRASSRIGVVGAGVMGGAIAGLAAESGLSVRLRDLSPEVLSTAILEHRKRVRRALGRRRMKPHEARAALDSLESTVTAEGFQRCDVVVEAVAERLDVKRAVFSELASVLRAEAILATNTSSLSVDAIADGVPGPERVVGLHFFNPVHSMPLVEIVRGKATSDETAAAAAKLALDLGKTPVVVKDVAGFLVNRLLGPYLDEAARLFEAGVDPARLEKLALDFGMPMGPLELLDEVGFDIAMHAAGSLFEAYGERMTPSGLLERIRTEKRLGKKTRLGFYRHSSDRKKEKTLAGDLGGFRPEGTLPAELSDRDVVDRLILSMVNEAARCMEETVVHTERELDLATVFGMGFPPFRGGLLMYADSIGPAEVVERLKRIAESQDVIGRPGGPAKFEPADLLVEMGRDGGRFHGE